MPAVQTGVTRAVDGVGDSIATLQVDGRHVQVTAGVSLAVRFDDSAHPIAYLGHAQAGTLPSSAGWRISRFDFTSGVVQTWADGNDHFDNVWDARASLSYS